MKFSHNISPQHFPQALPEDDLAYFENFPQDFPQEFSARISHKKCISEANC